MRYVPAPNPTRHAPSVSLLAVAKKWRVRSVSAFTSRDGAFRVSFSGVVGSAVSDTCASVVLSNMESRALGAAWIASLMVVV
jgi:hypothetical protein